MNPSSPAAPPIVDVSTPPPPPPVSPWVGYCRGALLFTGVCYALLGVLMVPLFFWLAEEDGDVAPVFGFFGFVMCAGFGALNFIAAQGLKKEARWGWIMAIALAGLYAPSACFPIGVLLLVGLLREDVRTRFLVGL